MPQLTPYHHGDLETALLDAATSLIEENGPTSVSLREVARRVGVSHAAPYRHFPDKRALLEAVALAGFTSLASRLDTVLERYADDARAQFIEGGNAYVAEAVEHPRRTQLMFGGVLDETTPSRILQEAAESAFSRCFAIVKNGQKAGLLQEGSSRGLVMTYWAATHGLAMLLTANQFGIPGTSSQADTLWTTTAEHLLDGMAADVRSLAPD